MTGKKICLITVIIAVLLCFISCSYPNFQKEYSYLAIGNSITRHGLASYWWDDDRGMAASSDEKDYVHTLSRYLKRIHPRLKTTVTNLHYWETDGENRSKYIGALDPYLSSSVDLVTIQLGENAQDLTSWYDDWLDLIAYVKAGCPNAEIVIVGDFWVLKDRDELKKAAAEYSNVKYASLEDIKGKPEYCSS